MRKRHTRLDVVRRLIETLAVCQGLVLRALCRRLLGRPPCGPELLREAIEKLGGAFIKFGQVASLQVELLPRAYCDALLPLLDCIPPFDRAHVERIFREELGALPETLFGNFEYTPIAAASIGQVHRGTLPDGTQVAIKVQRPDIDQVFERDCRVLEGMVRLIGVFRLRGLYYLRESVQELSAWTREELDYRREAAYCQYLGQNARNVATAEIPRVHWEYTTSRVLVLDFLHGPSVAQYVRLTDGTGAANNETLLRLRKEGFTPEAFTSNIIANFLRDAFLFGAFHADLHPANLLILPGNVVGYVDFGIVAFLTPETRRKVVRLIRAFASGDIQGMYECILEVCALQEGADLAAVWREMCKAGPGWYRQPAIHGRVQLRVSSTRAFLDLFATCREHGVFLDREMVRYFRSIFFVDGLLSRLTSGVDLAQELRTAVEVWDRNEARRKVSSAGNLLVPMTEAVLSAHAGPAGAVRSLEASGNRVHVSRSGSGLDPAAPTQVRALAIGAVWIVLAPALTAGNFFPDAGRAPFQAALAAIVLLAWTTWLVRSLRRLSVK